MNVHLHFFASVREQLGVAEETVILPDTIKTVGQLRRFLMEQGTDWQMALSYDFPIRMACCFEMASEGTELTEGCEVAFFPPVTGG